MYSPFYIDRMDYAAADILLISADADEYNAFDVGQNESEILFEKGMECPVPGCNVNSIFLTQAKFLRHWEERHIERTIKYECPVKNCKTMTKRRSDMKHHIKQKHQETNEIIIADLLKKCPHRVVEATNYVDPIFYSYQGRKAMASKPTPVKTVNSVPATTASVISAPDTVIPSTVTTVTTSSLPSCATSTFIQSNSTPMDTDVDFPVHNVNKDDDVNFTVKLTEKARLSVEEYKARSKPYVPMLTQTAIEMQSMADDSVRKVTAENTGHIIKNVSLPTLPLFRTSHNQETQTSNMDVNDLYFPPIPNSITELEEYLRFLCNTMDHVGRLRESAKIQLSKLRKTEPSLEYERQERRRLEAENRELKRELSELKWRQEVFGTIEM